jgi:hypothetical protein
VWCHISVIPELRRLRQEDYELEASPEKWKEGRKERRKEGRKERKKKKEKEVNSVIHSAHSSKQT